MADQANIETPHAGDIAPERLRCPTCQYSVFGLSQPRCPECGESFEWDVVEQLARGADDDLFEHEFYRDPLRALLRTWYRAALWPERIWSRVSPYNRPAVLPLLLFLSLQVLVFRTGWFLMSLIVDPAMNKLGSLVVNVGRTTPLRFVYNLRVDTDFFLIMYTWMVGTFVILGLFINTSGVNGSRWPHALRVLTYGTAFVSLCPALWCVLEAGIDFTLFFQPVPRFGWPPASQSYAYILLGQGLYVVGVIVTWLHLWAGVKQYLRLPYGWAISALTLVAGYIFADLVRTILVLT